MSDCICRLYYRVSEKKVKISCARNYSSTFQHCICIIFKHRRAIQACLAKCTFGRVKSPKGATVQCRHCCKVLKFLDYAISSFYKCGSEIRAYPLCKAILHPYRRAYFTNEQAKGLAYLNI